MKKVLAVHGAALIIYSLCGCMAMYAKPTDSMKSDWRSKAHKSIRACTVAAKAMYTVTKVYYKIKCRILSHVCQQQGDIVCIPVRTCNDNQKFIMFKLDRLWDSMLATMIAIAVGDKQAYEKHSANTFALLKLSHNILIKKKIVIDYTHHDIPIPLPIK